MEAVVVILVMAAWALLAAGCDWASRRGLESEKQKREPEAMISSRERVAGYVKQDAELESELSVQR